MSITDIIYLHIYFFFFPKTLVVAQTGSTQSYSHVVDNVFLTGKLKN